MELKIIIAIIILIFLFKIFIKILAILPVPIIPAVFPFKSIPVSPAKLKLPSLVLL